MKNDSYLDFLKNFFKENPLALLGFLIVSINIFLIFFVQLVAPYDPELAIQGEHLLPPSFRHLMGTDSSGMDIFSRVLYAPRVDFVIAFTATSLAVLIGAPIGVITGYYSGFISEFLARISDVIHSFPPFVLAMVAVAIAGQKIVNVIYVLALLNAPLFVRLLRTRVNSLREKAFIEAARCSGNTNLQIVFKHIWRNSWHIITVQFSVNVGWAMLLTAGLSFIGAGVPVPTPEWGSMISIGASNIVTGEWWVAFFPGLALGITVLGLAFIGETIEKLLDPLRRY